MTKDSRTKEPRDSSLLPLALVDKGPPVSQTVTEDQQDPGSA